MKRKILWVGLGLSAVALIYAALFHLGVLPRLDRLDAIFHEGGSRSHWRTSSHDSSFPYSLEWEGLKLEIGPEVASKFVEVSKGSPDMFLGSSLQDYSSSVTVEGKPLALRGAKLSLGSLEIGLVKPGDQISFRTGGVFVNNERRGDLPQEGK